MNDRYKNIGRNHRTNNKAFDITFKEEYEKNTVIYNYNTTAGLFIYRA